LGKFCIGNKGREQDEVDEEINKTRKKLEQVYWWCISKWCSWSRCDANTSRLSELSESQHEKERSEIERM